MSKLGVGFGRFGEACGIVDGECMSNEREFGSLYDSRTVKYKFC
jgi:hypothetical protein